MSDWEALPKVNEREAAGPRKGIENEREAAGPRKGID